MVRKMAGRVDSGSGVRDPRGARPGPQPSQRRFRIRPARVLLAVGSVVLALAVIVAGSTIAVIGRLDAQLERVPGVFEALDDGSRPVGSEVLTSVIVVTDSGAADRAAPSAVDDDEPDQVVLLAQVANGSASIVALRPTTAGDGMTPDSAYSLGGPTLLVRTIEDVTDLRVDHFFAFDLAGLPEMVDAVGGVNLPVADPAGDPAERLRLRPVDGTQALAYARGEPRVAAGAAGRTFRWPTTMRALVLGMSQELLLNPPAVVALLGAVGRSARADDMLGTVELAGMVVTLAGIRSEQVTFFSVPDVELGPTAMARGGSRIGAPGELWAAMQAGPLSADYLDRHPGYKLRWRGDS